MKLNHLIIIAAIVASPLSLLFSQNDKVYLKNDTKIVGKLVMYRPGDSVQIALANGQIVGFAEKDVKKVVMEDIKVSRPYNFKEKRWYHIPSFSLSFGKTKVPWSSPNVHLGISLEHTSGYQFSRWIGTGLGIGYDNYYVDGEDAAVFSVFNELRGYLHKSNTSAYYSMAGGIGFPLDNNDSNLNLTGHRGGFMWHPAVGFRFGASAKMNFFADIGVKFQRVYFNQINEWNQNRFEITYRRWILRGGIMF